MTATITVATSYTTSGGTIKESALLVRPPWDRPGWQEH